MKKILLLAIMASATTFAGAQVKFGLKAGVNLSSLKVSPAQEGVSYKIAPGFNAGFLANVSLLNKISLQPEVVYSSQGTKITSTEDGNGNYNLGYINVPVLLKYKTAVGFFVEAGPQVGFLLNAKAKSGDVSFDVKDSFNATDMSAVFGVGYMSPLHIGVDARYNLGLSNLDKSDLGKAKNGVIQVGVIYMF